MHLIELPPKSQGQPSEDVTGVTSLVVVGANGSGKTRFGAWVESRIHKTSEQITAYRIGAQRTLTLPNRITPKSFEEAQDTLYYGRHMPSINSKTKVEQIQSSKWNSEQGFDKAHNDFTSLLVVLLGDENKRNRELAERCRANGQSKIHRESAIDTLTRIWCDILPDRKLVFEDEKVSACLATGDTKSGYSGKHLSDGERVAIYLIGQAISAPPSAVIIVDEPELHLHRSVLRPLWDAIEKQRPDCLFIYLTHDVDFASSRGNAKKIWLKSFDGTDWEWDFVPVDASLPEPLLLQILGNRRPVLFVEGTQNSHDIALYRSLFPDRFVAPLASCAKVIEAVRAMKQLSWVSHLTFAGIVDLDRRNQAEVKAIQKDGVSVADVAEVENLFCLETVIKAVAVHVDMDGNEALEKCKTAAFSFFEEQLEQQVAETLSHRVYSHLKSFDPKLRGESVGQLAERLSSHVTTFGISDKSSEIETRYRNAVNNRDYREVLRLLCQKGLLGKVARCISVEQQRYVSIVLKLIRDEPSGVVAIAIREALGLPR